MSTTVKLLKRQIFVAIAMVMVAAIAVSTATYAWFVTNTAVTAQSATITATAAHTLLISPTGTDAWSTVYDFSGDADATITTFAPVSTIGIANGTTTALPFYKAEDWATDSAQSGAYNAATFVAADVADEEYFTKSFKIKAGQACDLYLDNSTVFAALTGDMDKTMRLALVVEGTDTDTYDGVYMYQIDATQFASGSTYNTTLQSLNSGATVNGITQAISAAGSSNVIGTIIGQNVDGTNGVTKVLASSLLTRNSSTLADATGTTADKLYAFTSADEEVTITAYIWMEGCDFDCNSSVLASIVDASANGGDDNQVTATLGFTAAIPGSGDPVVIP